jgi:hypothetical protein
MKPHTPADGAGSLPREAPARKLARQRKLRTILRKGLGLPRHELAGALWPGYAESYRPEQPTLVP